MTIIRSHLGAPVEQISAGTPPDGVTDAIRTMMRTIKNPGLSVAVGNRERVLLAAGYGRADRAACTPANQPWRTSGRMVAGDWNGNGGDGPGHVHWVDSDDPATPGKEINVEWALRDNPSAGPPDRLFRYGVAVGLLRPSPTPL